MIARGILEKYLVQLGMSSPKDGAQQFQVTLLRQWCDHLETVLIDNQIDARTAGEIIKAMIYGGAPTLAEAEMRSHVNQQYKELLEQLPIGTPGLLDRG